MSGSHDTIGDVKTVALMLIGVVVLIAVAVVLAVLDRGYEPEPVDHRDLGLPERPLTARDIPGLRFRIGWRGYRMEDVDAALDRLGESLQAAEGGSPPLQPAPSLPAEAPPPSITVVEPDNPDAPPGSPA
jgi:DivIVA domain-containing protein